MKKSELREMIREEFQNINESHASKLANNITKQHDWDKEKLGVILVNSKGKRTKPFYINKDEYNEFYQIVL